MRCWPPMETTDSSHMVYMAVRTVDHIGYPYYSQVSQEYHKYCWLLLPMNRSLLNIVDRSWASLSIRITETNPRNVIKHQYCNMRSPGMQTAHAVDARVTPQTTDSWMGICWSTLRKADSAKQSVWTKMCIVQIGPLPGPFPDHPGRLVVQTGRPNNLDNTPHRAGDCTTPQIVCEPNSLIIVASQAVAPGRSSRP